MHATTNTHFHCFAAFANRRLLLLCSIIHTMHISRRAQAKLRSLLSFSALSLGLIAAANTAQAQAAPPAEDIPYGGHHEFGVWGGYSGFTGPVWGYSRDVHYGSIDARYSYRLNSYPHYSLRYTPEATLFAALHETMQTEVNADAPDTRHAAGLSPLGFQLVYYPKKRFQPYLMTDEGMVYYYDGRVLSPEGSQFMFTIDFGLGANYFLTPRTAVNFGYRYQHSSNANISNHNPGVDEDIFYIGFSHFHTKGVR
jgi:opacity protein-like surface antigen